jgi:glycosyltransferase involved in cell wall biosynthesis
MKVLIIHCCYKNKGGEDTVVSEEINLLRANGVNAELLLFDNSRNTLLNVLQMPFNISSFRRTMDKLKSFRPDVVHIHNLHFSASPSVLYAIKKLKIPFIITLHNFRLICPSATLYLKGKLFLKSLKQRFPLDAILNGAYKNSRVLTFWLGLCMKLHQYLGIWKLASRYIVFSKHAMQIFMNSAMRLRADQIAIKPNFCSVRNTEMRRPADHFLFVGRLCEEKGIQLLLHAFSVSGLPIKIAGTGPLRNLVMEYSAKHPNIEYLGALNKNEVMEVLQSCSALIFPSLWYEGMPLTIIEAFGCGTPVIASKLGVMENMITPSYNGLHFEAGNENDLLEKIKEWKTLEWDQRHAYSMNARNTYEQYYTPEKNAQQLLSIYDDVVKQESEKRMVKRYRLNPELQVQ